MEAPSLSPLCLQRLAAIQQALNAQKISFLLRGGVRVLVALRDAGTGEPLGAPLQNRWRRHPGPGEGMSLQGPQADGP